MKQMRAFKIGARARKFAVEGCAIEGYDYLYGSIVEARKSDPELLALLEKELAKFEIRLASIDQNGETP